MRHLLRLAVLFLHLYYHCCYYYTTVSYATVEHRCIFDSIAKEAGPPSRVIVLRLPRRGRSGVHLMTASEPEWKPIRFGVFAEDLNDESRYCSAVGQQRSNFYGGTVVCRQENILTDAKRNIILNQVLPRATKLHAERLLVQPITDRIIVPNFTSGYCLYFKKPRFHHTEGVQGVDMVLYVAAGPITYGGAAWASYCTTLEDGRPMVGVVNFNSKYITFKEQFVRVAAHEIAHALGFDPFIMQNMGITKRLEDVRGKLGVLMVSSPKTLEKTRSHYKCPTALGMELEDEGGEGGMSSHWKMRNAKEELMASISGIGYYSILTMAFFEDLGFFRANWTMAETMNWGRNAGCDFLEEKCVINGTTKYPDMFCTSREDKNIMLCTSDRLALGRCPLGSKPFAFPPQFRYFANPYYGADKLFVDFCPYILPHQQSGCVDGYSRHMPGSRVGPTSRCLKGDNLYYKGKRIGGVCVEVECNKNSTVSMRYLGNNTWHACPEGESITPTGNFTGGKIVCSKYSEVCYETGSDR